MEEAELLLRPLAPAPWGTYCLPALLQCQSLDSPWRVLTCEWRLPQGRLEGGGMTWPLFAEHKREIYDRYGREGLAGAGRWRGGARDGSGSGRRRWWQGEGSFLQ